MSAPIILSGKALAEKIQLELQRELQKMGLPQKDQQNDSKALENPSEIQSELILPCLCVVTVDPSDATKSYLKNKKLTAEKIGFLYQEVNFPKEISSEELVNNIRKLGNDEKIHGIIVQLPVPGHLKTWEIVQAVPPEKDVDGLNAKNQGLIQVGLPCLMPCTPQGIMEILIHYNILNKKGLSAVVIGRSPLVGKPIANLLLGREGNCNVTVLHKNTADLSVFTKNADIIVSAVGKPGLITADMVKEGVVIVDVGINFIPSPNTKSGKKMVGDVDPSVYPKTRAYTPVPGGVGPMTVAMLMRNLMISYQRIVGHKELKEGWRGAARNEDLFHGMNDI